MQGTIYYAVIAKVIFSQVKITCYFHMWRYQVFAWKLTCYFIGVYIINGSTRHTMGMLLTCTCILTLKVSKNLKAFCEVNGRFVCWSLMIHVRSWEFINLLRKGTLKKKENRNRTLEKLQKVLAFTSACPWPREWIPYSGCCLRQT